MDEQLIFLSLKSVNLANRMNERQFLGPAHLGPIRGSAILPRLRGQRSRIASHPRRRHGSGRCAPVAEAGLNPFIHF